MPLDDEKGFSPSPWGIVLAAGRGARLEPLVRKLRGDDLPKQFVNFIGKRSMLEHTLARAEQWIPREQLFVVAGRAHLRFPEVRRQLAGRVKSTVVAQPGDKDTLPAVLLPLVHIYRRDPMATVVLLPADHFISPEDRFVTYIQRASRAVDREPARLVLLGAEPDAPESGYGYILSGEATEGPAGRDTRRVSAFVENPAPTELANLLERGALWNTMAMVFKAFTLLHLTARFAPSLHGAFERIGAAIGTRHERQAVDEAYRGMTSANFSTELLERLPEVSPDSLLVMPAPGVLWSDWGSPRRVIDALRRAGYPARAAELSEPRLSILRADHKERPRTRPLRKNAPVIQTR
jgi:mannose-1-phosphate guanylyltransferase